MATSQMSPADRTTTSATEFDRLIEAAAVSAEGQVLLSQDRCVDILLDLHNAAPTVVVRAMVADVLDGIRHLSSVRADEFAADLQLLAAADAVEGALFA